MLPGSKQDLKSGQKDGKEEQKSNRLHPKKMKKKKDKMEVEAMASNYIQDAEKTEPEKEENTSIEETSESKEMAIDTENEILKSGSYYEDYSQSSKEKIEMTSNYEKNDSYTSYSSSNSSKPTSTPSTNGESNRKSEGKVSRANRSVDQVPPEPEKSQSKPKAILQILEQNDWNGRFQEAMGYVAKLSTLKNINERSAVLLKMSHVAEDFLQCAKTYARIIISEVVLPEYMKTIKPIPIGTH